MPDLDPLTEIVSSLHTDSLVSKHAQRTGLDPELVRRVIGQESQGKPRAVSPKGAGGLMQLMPGTAQTLGVRNVFDPDENIRGGTDYLKQQLDKFGDVNLALAAYNAGPGAVIKHGNKVPPYAETQDYVRRIGSGYEGTGYAQDPLTEITKGKPSPQTPTVDPLTEITSVAQSPVRGARPELKIPQVTSTVTDVEEPQIEPLKFQPSQSGEGLNRLARAAGGLAETSNMQDLKLPANHPDLLGQHLEAKFNHQPTQDEIDAALLEQLGKGYGSVGQKFKAETGQSLTANGAAVEKQSDGSYIVHAKPTQGFIDAVNAYVQGGRSAYESTLASQAVGKGLVARDLRNELKARQGVAQDVGQAGAREVAKDLQLVQNAADLIRGRAPEDDVNARAIARAEESIPKSSTWTGAAADTALGTLGTINRAEALGGGGMFPAEQALENIHRGPEAAYKAGILAAPMLAIGPTARAVGADEMSGVGRQLTTRGIGAAELGGAAAAGGASPAEIRNAAIMGGAFPTGERGTVERPTELGIERAQTVTPEVGQPVAHPNAEIDGKPILAKTADDRVVVENAANKSGVSVVKHQPESVAVNSLADLGKEAKVNEPTKMDVIAQQVAAIRPEIKSEIDSYLTETNQSIEDATSNADTRQHRDFTMETAGEVSALLKDKGVDVPESEVENALYALRHEALPDEFEPTSETDPLAQSATQSDAASLTPAMKKSGGGLFGAPSREASFAQHFEGKKGEAGAIDVDLLTLGLRPFAKDVASRGRDVVAGTREIANGIQSLLAPPARSEQAQQTSRIVRANAAEMQRAHDSADKSLEGARKYFSSQQPDANYDFIDRMERGQAQSDPRTQKFADTLRKMLDERRDQVRALGTGKLESFIEDYFPHIWKDPTKAKSAFTEAFSKRPFEGSKSFLKKRTIPLTSEGLALRLEPVTNNPVELAVLKLREMDKYVMAHKVMGEMKDQGNLKFFKSSERLPDGWSQIDDRVATVFSRGEKGELILRGRYAAPDPAAKIINNYLSPGLNATMFRVPFKAWRATSNLLNQFQLGFSAFHAGMTTIDAMVSRAAAGFEDLARRRPIRAAKTLASTPISPITNLIQGSRMLKEWYRPGTQGTEIGRLVDAMQEGGGRARMDQFYSNGTASRFMDTLRSGNIIGAAIRAPGAAIEALSKPVMEQLVPRQKMGVFADLAKRELERLGPDATQAQVRHAMAKAWDSVDNRMGQLVYDNLFWNKTLKDLSMASVRSVGWNLGTIREIGGGLVDFASLPKRGIQKARGADIDPLFTHRMAYTAALPLVVGTMGAMTQYLMTGKRPETLKDYFFPKTGAEDENGNPERISFPSYMKDVFHAWEEPGKVVTNKLHPLAGLISEMLRNEDYYGTKIRNEDDPLVQQLKDAALHVGQSALPFSIRGYQKETERGGSLLKRSLPFIGITPAPGYIDKSSAEKLISRKVQATLPQGARTREQADRSQLVHQLQSKARNGQDISSDVQFAIKQGKLKPDDAHDILRDAKQTPLQLRYKHLPLKDALEVWDVMTPAERADVKEILADKADAVDDLPETEQPAVKEKMRAIGLVPGTKLRRPREPRELRKPRKPSGSGYVFQPAAN